MECWGVGNLCGRGGEEEGEEAKEEIINAALMSLLLPVFVEVKSLVVQKGGINIF